MPAPTETTPRRRMTADARRELVLRAALDEFAEHGYHGTSTPQIARRANITQSYIYQLFPDKKALFLACQERTWADVAATFRAAVHGSGTPEEKLHRMAGGYVELLANRSELLCQLQGSDHRGPARPGRPRDPRRPRTLHRRLRHPAHLHPPDTGGRLMNSATERPGGGRDPRALAAVVLAGLLTGSELTSWGIVHPTLWKLEHAEQVRAEKLMYKRFATVDPFLMTATTAACFAAATGLQGRRARLALTAGASYATMLATTLAGNMPINLRVFNWDENAGDPAEWRKLRRRWDRLHSIAEWRKLRRRWDRLHSIRVTLDTAGLLMIALAVLPD